MAAQEEQLIVAPTGRHGLTADIVSAHQRERLLAATIALVAKRGYRGTSIDQIVKAAKVGYVAFYDLFEGKEDCFLAAFERIVAETREELAGAISAEQTWPEQICAGLRRLVELVAAEPARARVGLVEIQAAGAAGFASYEAAVDDAIPKLQEGRAYKADAAALSDTLEEAIIGGIAWIFHQRLVKGETEKIQGLMAEAVQIALSPYLGEAEAQRMASSTAAA
jgi:AcrR family transcriptional regulator